MIETQRSVIAETPRPSRVVPIFPQGTAIPRVIHQVYFNPAQTQRHLIEENVDKLRRLNPRWEYRLYDDNDIVDYILKAYGAQMLAEYERIDFKYGAARADLFRYLLIYREGGVYLDVKASLDSALDERLEPGDVYLLSRWPRKGSAHFAGWGAHRQLRAVGGEEFQQWYIAAAPGHPFLRAVIEKVLRNIQVYNPLLHGVGREGVMWVTGPIAYTQAIVPLLPDHAHRIVDSHADLGLVYSIFGTSSARPHKSLFKSHYTALTDPVVAQTGARRWIWTLARPIYTYVAQPLRRVTAAIVRRLKVLVTFASKATHQSR